MSFFDEEPSMGSTLTWMGSKPITKIDIALCRGLISLYQQRLNLKHWRIDLSSVKPSKGALMEVAINRPRNHASIRVSDRAWEKSSVEFQRLLKHEILHIVFDGIREEHDFQMRALDTDRKTEYSERVLNQIEKAVEHLSYVL